jgi:hypothetical protein
LQSAETRTEKPSEALAQGEDVSLELLAAAETDGEVEVRLSCIVVAVYQMRLLIEARDLSRRQIRIADLFNTQVASYEAAGGSSHMQSFVRVVQYQVASDARDPPPALYPRLGNVFSVVAPIAREWSNLGVESLAAFHLIRGVAEGMQLGVLTGGRGALPFGFPALLVSPPPFARQVVPPIPSHTLNFR